MKESISDTSVVDQSIKIKIMVQIEFCMDQTICTIYPVEGHT